MSLPDETGNSPIEPERDYFCVSGQAVASKHFVNEIHSLAWQRRLLYNAAIDPKVPFDNGVDYRIALSNARREKRPDPEAPEKSETFLPVPTPFSLGEELTKVRHRHPMFAAFACEAQTPALNEACRARQKHVKDCVAAKAANKPLPRFHYRSIADDIDVSSKAFRIERTGAGNPQPNAKKKPTSLRNRNRRLTIKAKREADWIAKKRKAGWTETKIAFKLEERHKTNENSRIAQEKRQKAQRDFIGPQPKLARRDSPSAIIGHDHLRITIQGLPKIRVRLTRPIPDGAKVVRVHFTKQAGRGDKIKARLVLSLPANIPQFDPIAIGRQIHEAMNQPPADATPLQAVETARAAGLNVRGEDSGVGHPSVDDQGVKTQPVRRPRDEIAKAKSLQRQISRKDERQKQDAAKKTADAGQSDDQQNDKNPPVETKTDDSKKPTPIKIRRSNRAKKLMRQQRRIHQKWARRSRTRAYQDANRLVKDQILVATDPARMVAPLLKKDGPAERRAKTQNGVTATVDTAAFTLSPAKRRAMRANLHQTRLGLRIQHVGVLSERKGFIHATPGHEGTTKTCPKCLAVKAKGLNERTHDCPCGLKMPRDQASALVTLGRALLAFRDSPDPGNRIADALGEKAKAQAKTAKLKASRSAMGKKRHLQGVVALGGFIPAEHQESPSGFQTEALPEETQCPFSASTCSSPRPSQTFRVGARDTRAQSQFSLCRNDRPGDRQSLQRRTCRRRVHPSNPRFNAMKQFYLVIIWGDVEEQKFGPFARLDNAYAKAKRLLKGDRNDRRNGSMIIEVTTNSARVGAKVKLWLFNPFADEDG